MSKPMLPERVPPLSDRLRSLLTSMPPGRRATIATLTGWLSVTEDAADVADALNTLRAQRLATVEIEHQRGHRPVQWWGP